MNFTESERHSMVNKLATISLLSQGLAARIQDMISYLEGGKEVPPSLPDLRFSLEAISKLEGESKNLMAVLNACRERV